jgi:hypothetical protein
MGVGQPRGLRPCHFRAAKCGAASGQRRHNGGFDASVSEQIGKTGNDALHELEHFIERFEQRLTLNNLRLVERYLKFELHILLQFNDRRFGVEYVADLQRLPRTASVGPAHKINNSGVEGFRHLQGHSGAIIESNAAHREPRGGCEQQAVLIDIVKFVDLPESIVPSLVRLDSVQASYRFWPRQLYFPLDLERHVFIGSLANGEHDDLGRKFGGDGLGNERIKQVVKGTPEILENIANDGGYGKGNIVNPSKSVD